MGRAGFEPSPLTGSKTPISENLRTESGTVDAPRSPSDPDLAQIINLWSDLPQDIKKTIRTLIDPFVGDDEPLMKHRKSIGLLAFLKGSPDPSRRIPGCANYDHHHGGCLLADGCSVTAGKRCRYFETSVLPAAEQIGLLQQVVEAYKRHVGLNNGELDGLMSHESIRRCPECGGPLDPRQRYCDACKARRRSQTYRKSRSKRNS
jgi:hypothetical protein